MNQVFLSIKEDFRFVAITFFFIMLFLVTLPSTIGTHVLTVHRGKTMKNAIKNNICPKCGGALKSYQYPKCDGNVYKVQVCGHSVCASGHV